MNRRWFASRQLTAETWDGKTRYKVFETEEELEKRLNNWDKFLEDKEDREAAEKLAASSQPKATPEDSAASSQAKPTPETLAASSQSKAPTEKLIVASSTYEMAGDTDSSGDSDDEGGTKLSKPQGSYPVMQASGGFSFATENKS